eukprot:2530391-Pyramimonas_sp.AAC.1
MSFKSLGLTTVRGAEAPSCDCRVVQPNRWTDRNSAVMGPATDRQVLGLSFPSKTERQQRPRSLCVIPPRCG